MEEPSIGLELSCDPMERMDDVVVVCSVTHMNCLFGQVSCVCGPVDRVGARKAIPGTTLGSGENLTGD